MRTRHAEWSAGGAGVVGRWAAWALLVLVAVGGCRDSDLPGEPPSSSDPLLGTYEAVLVNGDAVPVPLGSQGTCGVQHLGGSVTLGEGLTYLSRLRRLRTTCPNGTTQESVLAGTGTFEVAGDSIYFDPGSSADSFFGSFESGALHIRHTTGDYVLVKK